MNTHSDRNPSSPVDILLVEDNPGDVRLTREAFDTADFEVTIDAVSDGADALEYLNDREGTDSSPYPDLILLDLNLRRMDGFEVLENIRDDPVLSRLPVLVLTSSEAQEDIIRSYELSANAYLTKPSGPDEFVSLVRAVRDFWVEAVHLPRVDP
ncbi:response regulator [Halostella sp. PRR32]|uniref:response regulator n=1 Tax=Halostella sp. PRR32 TaxID=3098147 RepID=UPI002B1DFB46|nr:response regulator [Halostella sp. PRR32]